jgi:uncharacterized protein (DUF1684 family)
MSRLDEFRLLKDQSFRRASESPLTPGQRLRFGGLAYFPESSDLVVADILEASDDEGEEITLDTSTGDVTTYRRAGFVRFSVDGEPTRVTLFSADDRDEFFLPFRDATSGFETYGAGRYLEVDPPGSDGRVIVDFNYAYNPYCAYNGDWSCPLPPVENWLNVPIRAGEKDFPDRG